MVFVFGSKGDSGEETVQSIAGSSSCRSILLPSPQAVGPISTLSLSSRPGSIHREHATVSSQFFFLHQPVIENLVFSLGNYTMLGTVHFNLPRNGLITA